MTEISPTIPSFDHHDKNRRINQQKCRGISATDPVLIVRYQDETVVSRATCAQYVRSGGTCSFACVGLLMAAGQVRCWRPCWRVCSSGRFGGRYD
eukprot:COSAG01_NODE_2029_length_8590_cov_5.719501_3_plen_95_part_00